MTVSYTHLDVYKRQALCYVYVCGKVRLPGVYTLPEGARIYEAVDLAGGFTDDAEDSWLNLAEPVTDGMKLEVPSKAQAGDPAWQAQNQNALTGNRDAGNSVAGQHVLVNLNTASLEELMTLKAVSYTHLVKNAVRRCHFMMQRICPVCDQVMKHAHYCSACHSWVKDPVYMNVTYYLNERHPKNEAHCSCLLYTSRCV